MISSFQIRDIRSLNELEERQPNRLSGARSSPFFLVAPPVRLPSGKRRFSDRDTPVLRKNGVKLSKRRHPARQGQFDGLPLSHLTLPRFNNLAIFLDFTATIDRYRSRVPFPGLSW